MTHLIVRGQTWEAFAEAFRNLDLAVQRVGIINPHEAAEFEPPTKKSRHHDHLIERHIRSVRRN